MTEQRQVLNRTDLERETGIPAETWRYWAWRGEGPRSYRVGRRVYVDRAEFDAWWEAHKASDAA